MFVYADSEGRITAAVDDEFGEEVSGRPGWHEVPERLEEPIFVLDCSPVYKYADGHAVQRSNEEIDADIPHTGSEPEEPSELEQLRAQVREQQAQLDEQADALIELAGLIGG